MTLNVYPVDVNEGQLHAEQKPRNKILYRLPQGKAARQT
jgi:hypothetical protein